MLDGEQRPREVAKMDERRWQELTRKRDTSGLTAQEADELGKMMAEREGKPYSNAAQLEHPEADLTDVQPYSEAEVEELKEHPEVRETPEESEKAS
jgi:hypothetical protein